MNRECRRHRPYGRPDKKLFWRIYIFGLLVLVATCGAFAVAMNVVTPQSPWERHPERVAQSLAIQAEALEGGADLDTWLEQVHLLLDIDVAVYTREGELVGVAGSRTPKPLEVSRAESLDGVIKVRDGWHVAMAAPIRTHDGRGWYVVGSHDARTAVQSVALGLLLVLIAAAIVLYPLARSIARPLERIARAADRLGAGELDARSGVERPDEIGLLARAFDRMAERIQRLLLSEKELMANVSHEFRTPLARMRVAVELAEEAEDAERVRRQVQGIGGDVDELERLVDDVLTASRLELAAHNGEDVGFSLRPDVVAINDLLLTATERVEQRFPEMVIEDAVQDDLVFEADPVLLQRLLDNLLANAGKYAVDFDTPTDTPVTVHAEIDEAAGLVILEVRDRGPGIEEADRSRLTEPFFRVDRSRGQTGGVGLGLTLCRRIVEVHGGSIEFLDAAPGLLVRVTLPTHVALDQAASS